MRRRLGVIFRLLCLLIFVGSVTLWERSYFVGEGIWRGITWVEPAHQPNARQDLSYGIRSAGGTLGIARWRIALRGRSVIKTGWNHERGKPDGTVRFNSPGAKSGSWQFGPFQIVPQISVWDQGWVSVTGLVVPLWLFLPFGLPPLRWLMRRRRARARGFAVTLRSPGSGAEARAAVARG